MTSLSPVSFCAKKQPVIKKQQDKTPVSVPNNASSKVNPFNAQLMALALIGAATLQSCVKTDLLEEYSKEVPTISDITNNEEDFRTTAEKFDGMLKDLGLLKDSIQSVNDVKSVSFEDENGEAYFIKATDIKNSTVTLKQLQLHPDFTGEESKMVVKSSNDSIFVTITSKDNSSKKMYKKDLDNSYNEYTFRDGIYFESGKLFKNENGDLVKTAADGTQKVFTNISNSEEMPSPITFDPNANGWNDVNSDVDF